jgi:hypothetical protein
MSLVYVGHLPDETVISATPFCVKRKALVFHKKSRPEERPLTSVAQSLRINVGAGATTPAPFWSTQVLVA